MDDLGYLNIKHFKVCEKPKNINFGKLPKDTTFLKSEEGYDWYVIQKLFKPDTLKIVYDDDYIIKQANTDVSLLMPEEMSVVELPIESIPKDFNLSGEWKLDINFNLIKDIDFYYQCNNSNKKYLLSKLREKIEEIEDKHNTIGYISNNEKYLLDNYYLLKKKLYTIDINVPFIIDYIKYGYENFIENAKIVEDNRDQPLNLNF